MTKLNIIFREDEYYEDYRSPNLIVVCKDPLPGESEEFEDDAVINSNRELKLPDVDEGD